MAQYAANPAKITWANPFLFLHKCAGYFLLYNVIIMLISTGSDSDLSLMELRELMLCLEGLEQK